MAKDICLVAVLLRKKRRNSHIFCLKRLNEKAIITLKGKGKLH